MLAKDNGNNLNRAYEQVECDHEEPDINGMTEEVGLAIVLGTQNRIASKHSRWIAGRAPSEERRILTRATGE